MTAKEYLNKHIYKNEYGQDIISKENAIEYGVIFAEEYADVIRQDLLSSVVGVNEYDYDDD